MQLWEFISNADKANDLGQVENAREWLAKIYKKNARDHINRYLNPKKRLPKPEPMPQFASGVLALVASVFGMEECKPSREQACEWNNTMQAFRLIVRRVKLRRSKWPVSTDIEDAETIARSYVAKLVTEIGYPGVRIGPDAAIHYRVDLSEYNSGMSHEAASSAFWQLAFGSIFLEGFESICGDCGKPLGLTATGKPRRGSACKNCLTRRSWYSKPVRVRRKLKREQMSRYRQA